MYIHFVQRYEVIFQSVRSRVQYSIVDVMVTEILLSQLALSGLTALYYTALIIPRHQKGRRRTKDEGNECSQVIVPLLDPEERERERRYAGGHDG